MAITNGYASLSEFKALPEITSTDATDDATIEDIIERASRAIDTFCGTWFYGATSLTRYYDTPRRGRVLQLDAPLLALTTLTNGNGTTIASTEYTLWPYNGPCKTEIRLLPSSATIWELSTASDSDRAISVAGTWGYVDRTATDPQSVKVILATNDACLIIALAAYRKRYGLNTDGVATVTAAGVVISPRGLPIEAQQLLLPYRQVL